MSQFQVIESPAPSIDRPPCPACGWPMWIARVEPDKPEHDRRTLECPRCELQEVSIVKRA